MAYYVEYEIPAGPQNEQFEMPVSEEQSGYTIPLTETDAPVIDTDELSARSGVFGATLAEAKTAAEEIISHSKATRASLYEDPSNSTSMGVGTLVAEYAQDAGWSEPAS